LTGDAMVSVPPKISSGRAAPAGHRLVSAVLVLVALGLAGLIYFFNPSAHAIYPVCQFHRLTGLNCPGCGGTRAAHALLHGRFIEAAHDNALLVAGAAVAVVRGAWRALNRWRGRPNGSFVPSRLIVPLLVALALFGVLRNLPAFAFLSP
jgi:hypothetical protein